MPNPRRLLAYVVVGLTGIIVLVGTLFAFDRMAHTDEVLRGVSVGSVDLGGLDQAGAAAALQALQDEMYEETLPVRVEDTTFALQPGSVDFQIDKAAAFAEAERLGRQGSIITQFRWWLGHLFDTENLPIPGTVSSEAVDQLILLYEEEALDTPPFEGAIEVEDTTPIAVYPTAGKGIDERSAEGRIRRALVQQPWPESVTLDVVDVPPTLSVTDIDNALVDAQLLLAGPIELTRTDPDASVVLTEDQLARALISTAVTNSIPHMDVGFDPAVIDSLLAPVRAEFEAPPKNAEIRIDEEDNVVLFPGRPGALIDAELAAAAAEEAARLGTRTAELPFQDGALPEVTTEDLEQLGIEEKISEFTTFHPCCQARVTNIHLFADIVDGTIVMPGEELSLNELVGQRTTERGFLPAPTIIGGKLEDTVGGGVSQFATTFYNAVFDAGLEDIAHKPHSYYFSRYPEGIEATISWPQPDLVFRNDTEAAILIRTEYTDESITVKFFGDNGGRRVTTRDVSDRYGFTNPPTEYILNPDRAPEDGERVVVSGAQGWSVKVTRVITYPDGRTDEDSWVVIYRPQPREVELHPCLIPEGAAGHTGEECPEPETTTTTAPPDGSSTTLPPDDDA